MFYIKAVEKFKTHLLCSVTFFRKSYRLRDNVKNMVGLERPQTIRRLRVACWISKVTRVQEHSAPIHLHACSHPRALSLSLSLSLSHTHTHTHTQKHEILVAFPQQQSLHERTGMLRYMYVVSLVSDGFVRLLSPFTIQPKYEDI
jgi:hypothetical protein